MYPIVIFRVCMEMSVNSNTLNLQWQTKMQSLSDIQFLYTFYNNQFDKVLSHVIFFIFQIESSLIQEQDKSSDIDNSQTSATAYKAKHSLKMGGGVTKPKGTSYNFDIV